MEQTLYRIREVSQAIRKEHENRVIDLRYPKFAQGGILRARFEPMRLFLVESHQRPLVCQPYNKRKIDRSHKTIW